VTSPDAAPVLRLGNAPVSYGVYGAGAGGPAASPRQLLAAMAQAGYQGSELGPPGFFGPPDEVAAGFAAAGLAAIGGYVPIHFAADDATVEHDLDGLDRTCRELAACSHDGLVILADEGRPELLNHPARPWDDRSLALDDAGWQRLARLAGRAAGRAAAHGLRTSFHPHIATYVESPWEVERLLEATDIQLTLDIGHLQLAGASPPECARAWRSRINHVHVKDVRLDVLRRAQAERREDFDSWWAEVATPLGDGDVDIDAVLDELAAGRYAGWLVVEQDRAPTAAADYPRVAAEQSANRSWLAARLAAVHRGSS
jgi:inosose dehydratase